MFRQVFHDVEIESLTSQRSDQDKMDRAGACGGGESHQDMERQSNIRNTVAHVDEQETSHLLNVSFLTAFSDVDFEKLTYSELEAKVLRRESGLKRFLNRVTSEHLDQMGIPDLSKNRLLVQKHKEYVQGLGDYALINEYSDLYDRLDELQGMTESALKTIDEKLLLLQGAQRQGDEDVVQVENASGVPRTSETAAPRDVWQPNSRDLPCMPATRTTTAMTVPKIRLGLDQNTGRRSVCDVRSQIPLAPLRETSPIRSLRQHREGNDNDYRVQREVDTRIDERTSTPEPYQNGDISRIYDEDLLIPQPRNSLEIKVNTVIRTIQNTINQVIDRHSSEAKLTSVMITDIPKLEKVQTSADSLLQLLMKNEELYGDAIERMTVTLDKAEIWMNNSLGFIKKNQLDVPDDSKNIVEPIKLKPFSGWSSETNVFDFLADFKKILGTAKQSIQATALYKNYLSTDIQKEVEHIKNDYKKMVAYLIHRYGDARRIVASKKKLLENLKYHPKDMEQQIKFFRSFTQVIQNLESLLQEHQVNVSDLGNELFNQAFLKALPLYLPEYHRRKYRKALSKMERNSSYGRITDEEEFMLFKKYVQEELLDLEDYVSEYGKDEKKADPVKETKPKQVSLHLSDTVETTDFMQQEKTSPKPNFVKDKPKGSFKANNKQTNYGKKTAKNYIKKVVVKCPMHEFLADHKNHTVGDCPAFVKATPQQREMKVKQFRLCQTCLGDWCGANKEECCNLDRVPEALICQMCMPMDKKRPKNVLLCQIHTKNEALISQKLDYLPGYVPSSKLQLAHISVSYVDGLMTLEDHKEKSSVAYNVNDGSVNEISSIDNEEIIPANEDQSIYMLQELKISGMDCLTMYDTGSSGEAIMGEFAEAANFVVVNPNTQQVNVAGGSSISTGYGTYKAVIGPLTSGKYTEKILVGLKNITHCIPMFDLTEVNQELKDQYPDIGLCEKLPLRVGGQRIKLLIGIKSTELMPEKICELPSGLMVFRAKIKDKFGSTLLYGGPHKSFTNVHTQYNQIGFTHMTVMFTELYRAYQDSPRVASRHFNIANNIKCPKDFQDLTCETDLIEEKMDNFAIPARVPEAMYQVHPTPIEKLERESALQPNVSDCIKKGMSAVQHDQVNVELKQEESLNLSCLCCSKPVIIDSEYVCGSPLRLDSDHITLENPMSVPGYIGKVMEPTSIYKMRKPVKPLKAMEEEEEMLVYRYRCADCQNCQTCLTADKTKMISVREEEEQKLIQKSVFWDRDEKLIYCSYPWITEPDEALSRLWDKNSNESQAYAILQHQRKKPSNHKQSVLKFHQELVDQGFVSKVTDLSQKQQDMINNAKVKQFMPWRAVYKMDSVSTPCRMVTDPSVTHFNTLLAKGTNQLSNLYSMIVNFRTHLYAYSFDISKMYNTLRLTDEMLPYSLYYMSPNLDSKEPAEVWCFLTLIYGLVCAGNLAMFAVRLLVTAMKNEYPKAYEALVKWLYMDDGFSGANTKEELENIIHEIETVLPMGGFKIKCMTRSGDEPCEKASSDKISTGLAGYKWLPKTDEIKLGLGELNFNKKVRGYRRPNEVPVDEPEDVEKVLPDKITRRIALGKTAEFWDLIGILEPLKVKFKIDLKSLTSFGWDDNLPSCFIEAWTLNFKLMVEARNIAIKRAIVPVDAVNPDLIEIITMCDASTDMCAAAVYARFLRKDGSYSCNLLTARSRSVDHTIPRNELCGAVLAAETTFAVLQTIGKRVTSYTCCTDSGIALSWLMNQDKLLKPFCFNRVRQCHRLVGEKCWRHVPGHLNTADIATKGNVSIDDVHADSVWMKGYSWMQDDLCRSPLKTYQEICENLTQEQRDIVDKEAIIDPEHVIAQHGGKTESSSEEILIVHHTDENNRFLIDFVQLGFRRSFRILTIVIKFCHTLKHKIHTKAMRDDPSCSYCSLSTTSYDTEPFRHVEKDMKDEHKLSQYSISQKANIVFTNPMDVYLAKQFLSRKCTEEVKSLQPQSKWKQYIESDGILYCGGRLSTLDHITTVEDLNTRIKPFYEEIHYLNPVAHVSSPIIYSLMIHLHTSLQHCGVERLLGNTWKVFYVEGARSLAKRIRKDCIACKIKLRKTYKTICADQNRLTYTIAPAFYACQIDIISKFKAHDINVRTRCDCYVLIIVCCLTQAVSLHVLERYDTESVISALTRHSSRFGWPRYLLPDEGSQLLKLKDLKFSLRDLQQRLWVQQQVILDPCSPKSHWEHGRVESRIAAVRESLMSMINFKNSLIGWETIMATIAAVLNSIPITRGNDDRGVSNHEFDLITPYLCLLGHNSNRTLEGTFLLEKHPSKHLEKVRTTMQEYFKHLIGTMHRLIPAPDKWKYSDPPEEGDVVLFLEEEGMKRDSFKYGRILETNVDGKATKVRIGYRNAGEKVDRQTFRHPRNCVKIWKDDEIDFNTTAHFQAVSVQHKHERRS